MISRHKLSNLCNIQSGGTPSRSNADYWGGEILWAKISDIEAANGRISLTKETITSSGLTAIRNRFFKKGTLLFAMYGSVGKTAICETEMTANQAILGINIKDETHLDMSYLKHWLASKQGDFMNDARGVAQKNLSAGYIRDLTIPLPPLEEQKRIAAVLDKVDALRRKRERAIQLTDDLLRSVFLDMFGQEREEWKHTTVEEIASQEKGSIRTGPFGSQLLHSEFTDSGIAVLGIDNAVTNEFKWAKPRFISEQKYKELKRYTVLPKDLLITIMGTCGRAAIVPENIGKAINTKHLCCITLDKNRCIPEFLHAYFLLHPTAKKYLGRSAKGAVMDGLNMGIIKKLPVLLPSIKEQEKFAKLVHKHADSLVKQNTAEDVGANLFASLSQRAFSGELTASQEEAA